MRNSEYKIFIRVRLLTSFRGDVERRFDETTLLVAPRAIPLPLVEPKRVSARGRGVVYYHPPPASRGLTQCDFVQDSYETALREH